MFFKRPIIKRPKRLILSCLATIFFMYLFFPLYSTEYIDSLYQAFINHQLRVDISLNGANAQKININNHNFDFISQPLIKTAKQKHYANLNKNIQSKIHHGYKKYHLSLSTLGEGTLKISLSAPDNDLNNGKYFPLFVYYNNLTVNGQKLLNKDTKASFATPYVAQIAVKPDQKIDISFEAKRDMMPNWSLCADVKMFISFLIISFLCAQMLIYWLAKFKIFEHKSRLDVVFLSIFFMLLILPMTRTDNLEKTIQENRMLAQYKPLVASGGGINQMYGKDFENWFNDHFLGRRTTIRSFNKFCYFLNNTVENNNAFAGKKHWLFTKEYNSVANYQNRNLFTASDLQQIKSNLHKFQKWAKKHKFSTYIMLTPDKEKIYGEYYPQMYQKQQPLSRIEQLYNFIKTETNIPIVYPVNELLAGKKDDLMYFKTDTHWTHSGAFIGYQALMNLIKQDYTDLHILTKQDFTIKRQRVGETDLIKLLDANINKLYSPQEQEYNYLNLKKANTKCKSYNHTSEYPNSIVRYDNTTPQKYNALIIGDSFNGSYRWYMAESFNQFYHLFYGSGANFDIADVKNVINSANPNILIIQSTERFLERFLDFNVPD